MPPAFTTETVHASQISAREQLPPTMKPSPACAPRGGAPSLRRRRNDSLPLSLRRAFRHLPARVVPPPFAPLRGAPSRTDWLGASGRQIRDLLWLLYGGLLKLATSAVRASARVMLSTGPQVAHKSASLPSAHFFSSAARGMAPFGAERFFVRGGAPKMTAGTYNKYRKAQLAAVVLEIKEP